MTPAEQEAAIRRAMELGDEVQRRSQRAHISATRWTILSLAARDGGRLDDLLACLTAGREVSEDMIAAGAAIRRYTDFLQPLVEEMSDGA